MQYLEALAGDPNQQKSEYSLTQHLANNLIDLYINLPSKNNFRRPASYTSKGYRTRRMAVDFAVPLITNVKCAKLFIEALVRNYPLDISNVDFKTSHRSYTFPGLVNTLAFVPSLAGSSSVDIGEVTRASIASGFTTVQLIPRGIDSGVVDERSLKIARGNAAGAAHCNYAFAFAASATNASLLTEDLVEDVKSLFIPFNDIAEVPGSNKVAAVASHFTAWPADKPIITDAKGTDLASVLLLASLNNRSVHVANVSSRDDILLIALSKEKQLQVTCDVSVYSLFFTREEYPACTSLPSAKDQAALWQNLNIIDVFSVGPTPHQMGEQLGEVVTSSTGIEETLPLLLGAVSDGRLTIEALTRRLHDNPIRIFDLPEQPHTHVEVVVDRKAVFSPRGTGWSPLAKKLVSGSVHRVIVNNVTVVLDGTATSQPLGQDVSSGKPSGVPTRERHFSKGAAGAVRPTFGPDSRSPQPDGAAEGTISQLAEPRLALGQVSPTRAFAPITPHPAFHRRHILSVKQFTPEDLYDLFNLAHEMRLQVERNGTVDILKGRVLCTLFYEPSTRTSSSFEAAMKRCGGEVIQIPLDRSSVMKGETLADTVRTLGCYADAIVLRHPSVGSAQTAAKYSPIPILNAGDGIGEHPSQALLDIYTIRSELGTVNGKTITLLGDLKNGRTVHSLVTLLSFYSVRLNFVAPAALAMPDSVVSHARRAGIPVKQYESLDEVLGETDVLYVTRVQKERFEDEKEYESLKDRFIVNQSVMARAKADMIVMHPLPRVNGEFALVTVNSIADVLLQKLTPRLTSTLEELCTSVKCVMDYL